LIGVKILDKRIYHDSRVSYLVIDPGTDIATSLSMNMIKNNKIQGLLDMECRNTDNKMELYYGIQGMQCLKEYIGEYNISYNLARQLYLDIAHMVLNGEEFLLSENSYVMDLEYIFLDKKNKRIKFCCIPEWQGDFQADIKKLTEELIECICHNDKNAVEFIYGIYGLITDNGFIISDIKSYIKEFKPGAVNSAGYCDKRQRNIPVADDSGKIQCTNEENIADGNIIMTDRKNTKEIMHKKYILCADKASLPFKVKEKREINVYFEDICKRIDESHLETSVGRNSDCNLILPASFVSRHHAIFYIEDEDIYIEDLSSANGTFINDGKIPANVKILCNVNDVISFAGIKWRLSYK